MVGEKSSAKSDFSISSGFVLLKVLYSVFMVNFQPRQMPGQPGMMQPGFRGGPGGPGGGMPSPGGDGGGYDPMLLGLISMGLMRMLNPSQEVMPGMFEGADPATQGQMYQSLMGLGGGKSPWSRVSEFRGMGQDDSADRLQGTIDAQMGAMFNPRTAGGAGWSDMLQSMLPMLAYGLQR